MSITPSLFLALSLISTSVPTGAPAGPGVTVSRSEIAANLTSLQDARTTLGHLRTRSWQTCRREHRFGAMAERRSRQCRDALLDAVIVRLDLPCLSAIHRDAPLSRQAASCNKEE